MDIAELGFRVDSGGLVQGEQRLDSLAAASGRTEKATGRMERAWKRIAPTLKILGAAAAAAGVALGVMVNNAIRNIQDIALMASQIGTTTEALSSMRYAAEQMASVSSGQFDMALRRMTRRISEAAAGGGPAADALKRLGLNAQELARQRPDEQFRRFADAIKDAGDQGQRLRATMALMDTEGMPLVTMLQQGSAAIREYQEDAERLGIVIDQRLVKDAEKFRTELGKLNAAKQGIIYRITSELLPSLTRMSQRFDVAEGAADRLDKTARIASTGVKLLASVGVIVTGVFQTLGEALGGIAAAIVQLVQGNWREALAINRDGGQQMIDNIKGIWDGLKDVWADRPALDEGDIVDNPAVAGALNDTLNIVSDGADKIKDEAAKIHEEVERTLARIRRDIDTFSMSETQTILYDLRVDGATPEQLRRAEADLNHLDLLRDERDLLDAVSAAQERRWQGAGRMLEAIRAETQLLGMSADEQELWNNLKWAGVEAESALGKAIIKATEDLQYQRKIMEPQIAAMDSLRQNTASLFEEFATGSRRGSDAFKSFADSLIRDMARIASQQMSEALFGQAGSAGGGFWGSLFGSLFGGGRASGGPMAAGRAYLVGEQGPEIVQMGHGTGHVVPNHALMRGGGGSAMSVEVNIENQSGQRMDASAANVEFDGERLVIGIIARDIAEGGQTVQAMKGRLAVQERV